MTKWPKYVLIVLTRDKLTHQDLGQMQMYVNYFERYVKTEEELPTIGIVLCHRKNDALVELTLPNPGYRIKPGMYAEAEWVESKRSAMVVPLTAVVDRAGQKYVFLTEGEQARLDPVTVGVVAGDAIEILTGLQAGQRVVTTGASLLNEKDKIKIIDSSTVQK